MLLNKRGRGELESLLHCNSEDAIKTCMNEKKKFSVEEVVFVHLDYCERVRGRQGTGEKRGNWREEVKASEVTEK